jgi:hypothetical protein
MIWNINIKCLYHQFLLQMDALRLFVRKTNNIHVVETPNQLGFYNAPPIAQPSPAANNSTFIAGSGTTVTNGSLFGTGKWTITDVVLALEKLGLLGIVCVVKLSQLFQKYF